MTTAILHAIFQYFIRIGDGISQLLNVIVFFGTNPNESISGRAHRLGKKHKPWHWLEIAIDWIFSPIQPKHCEESHNADISRAAKFLREG